MNNKYTFFSKTIRQHSEYTVFFKTIIRHSEYTVFLKRNIQPVILASHNTSENSLLLHHNVFLLMNTIFSNLTFVVNFQFREKKRENKIKTSHWVRSVIMKGGFLAQSNVSLKKCWVEKSKKIVWTLYVTGRWTINYGQQQKERQIDRIPYLFHCASGKWYTWSSINPEYITYLWLNLRWATQWVPVYIYIYIYIYMREAIVFEKRYSDSSSNPRRFCLHSVKRYYPWESYEFNCSPCSNW